jgi:predicted dehydrogenase
VRILRDLPTATLVGFHDHNAARAAEVSAALGVPALPSLEALLDAVDAVSVVVPTTAHHAVAGAALARGRHCFVEKPITVTLAEADALVAAAEAAGVVLQTGHVERFNRAVRAARPFIAHPRFIESDRLAPFSPRGADVPVVLDLMIHDIDLVTALVGAPVTEVRAVGVPVLTPTLDLANARLAFADGAVATITASRVSRDRVRRLRIFQPTGYLSLDLAAGTGEFLRLRRDVDLAALAAAPQALEAYAERVPLEAPDGEPLWLELAAFVEAVAGRAPVPVSGRDGRAALAVALAIVDAIALGGVPAATG